MFIVCAISGLLTLFHSAVATPLEPLDFFHREASGCPTANSQLSCHNTTVQNNLCCFESPGGLLLQTQFWDTNPSTGPADSWTIHGLWPDNCDGTFEQNCDPSRFYADLAGMLTSAGATDTLSFMQEFWVDINGQSEQFWEHEWDKHGTCMSTLEPSCLSTGSARGAEAVAFFNTVVRLFKMLPTFEFLAREGITPTNTKTFTLDELNAALKRASGFIPALSCEESSLNEAWWYFNLKGSVIDGSFVQIDAPFPGSCPDTGIKYTPKFSTASAPPAPTPTSGAFPVRATITAVQSTGGSVGGLLSTGTWSTQTLATYRFAGDQSSFTMTSSKGNCAIQNGTLTCGSGVAAGATFSAVNSGGHLLLAASSSTEFSSDNTPSGTVQLPVFTGRDHAQTFNLKINGVN